MRSSFVVYAETLDYAGDLTDAQLGQLYRAQLTYATGGTPVVTDPEVRGIWRVVKHRMDVDAEKYESKCQQARANASGRKRTQADATESQRIEGDTVTVTDNETVTDKTVNTPNGVKPAKHKHGQHVLLTDEEYAKLIADHGEAQANAAVAFLDEYIERRGYKVKSHYLALRKWVFDALREEDIKRRELEQREQRLRDQSKPRGGHFAAERKEDIDGEILSGVIRRITADG